MRVNISIEARMTSSRLPGKVLKNVIGKPFLELMIERIKRAKYIDDIIIATTINQTDDPIIELCEKLKVKYYRGSELDVLERVYLAHKEFQSDIVIETTGDCPLIEPKLIDNCILTYLNQDFDYVATSEERTYPNGQNIQVFAFKLLEYLNYNALTEYDREHVSPHIYQNPDKFNIKYIDAKKAHFAPDLRLTLDTQEDFAFIKEIYEHFYPSNKDFNLEEILKKFYFSKEN